MANIAQVQNAVGIKINGIDVPSVVSINTLISNIQTAITKTSSDSRDELAKLIGALMEAVNGITTNPSGQVAIGFPTIVDFAGLSALFTTQKGTAPVVGDAVVDIDTQTLWLLVHGVSGIITDGTNSFITMNTMKIATDAVGGVTSTDDNTPSGEITVKVDAASGAMSVNGIYRGVGSPQDISPANNITIPTTQAVMEAINKAKADVQVGVGTYVELSQITDLTGAVVSNPTNANIPDINSVNTAMNSKANNLEKDRGVQSDNWQINVGIADIGSNANASFPTTTSVNTAIGNAITKAVTDAQAAIPKSTGTTIPNWGNWDGISAAPAPMAVNDVSTNNGVTTVVHTNEILATIVPVTISLGTN